MGLFKSFENLKLTPIEEPKAPVFISKENKFAILINTINTIENKFKIFTTPNPI